MLKTIATAVAVVAAIGALVSWFVIAINMIRITFHIKDGATIYGRKTNVMFRPQQLTERGLAVRRQFFYGLIGFVVCAAIMYVCSIILK